MKILLAAKDAFAKKFGCGDMSLPRNVVLVGWSAADEAWFVTPHSVSESGVFRERVPVTLGFLGAHVVPRFVGRSFWFAFCFGDGWRERIPYSAHYRWVPVSDLEGVDEWREGPGELPLFSPDPRPIACYGAHRGDPSALLLPEAHYLARNGYTGLFAEVRADVVPWSARLSRAVFCGGDHGETANYFSPLVPGRPHPRRYLKELVTSSRIDVDVHLGQGIPRAAQMAYRWILDVDGYARTWDAWAWKLLSGSVVLSPASPWESFFTRQFDAWEHYVPVANDFSDLAQRLEWCRSHDEECQRIAQRARQRAEDVYQADCVVRSVVRQLRPLAEDLGLAVRLER